MPILLAIIGLLAPRAVLIVLALFTSYLARVYTGLLLPLVGFVVAPTTTLAYAVAVNTAGGVHGSFWLLVMVLAVVLDLGSWRWGRFRF